MKTGLGIVQNYDLMGAITFDPTYKLSIMAKADAADTALIQERAHLVYSGRRVDYIDRDKALTDAEWNIPAEATNRQWFDLILKHPLLYLRVRWEAFPLGVRPAGGGLVPADLCGRRCARREDGAAEPHPPLRACRHPARQLFQLVPRHAGHEPRVLCRSVVGGWRVCFCGAGSRADIVMIGLQLAGVAFAASFFIISIACDYRYLYFTDVAAMAGLIYAAVEPPTPWRKRAPS